MGEMCIAGDHQYKKGIVDVVSTRWSLGTPAERPQTRPEKQVGPTSRVTGSG